MVHLANRAGAANPPALKEHFAACEQRLLAFLTARLGSRAEAQDVAQSAFLKLWERAPELRESNLTSLIFVTARNLATDRLRSRKWSAAADSVEEGGDEIAQVIDEAPAADRVIAARHDLKIISLILRELPDKCRTAFIRYKFEGESYIEIAAAMLDEHDA